MDTFWCVDPWDGTKEFIKKNDEFTVNIALVEQHQSVIGVIHVPVTNETIIALQGEGAFKVQDNQTQRLAKKSRGNHAPPIFAVSRSHLNEKTKAFIDLHQAKTVPAGSSLKLTLLAEGKVDVYPRFGPTSLWDMAAGHAILKETGGEIFEFTGRTLSYHVSNISNPDLLAIRDRDAIYKYLSE